MAPLPPISNVYRVVPNFTSHGQRCANVLHFTLTQAGATAVLTELAGGYVSWWSANIKPLVPATMKLDSVDVTDLGPSNPASINHVPGSAQVGTNASPGSPNSVAACISLKTGVRGRSFRGRIYHLGMTESQVTADGIEAATIAALKAAYTLLINLPGNPNSAPYKLGVLSYYANKQLRGTPVFTPVVTCEVDPFVDSQRRRLTGRGN